MLNRFLVGLTIFFLTILFVGPVLSVPRLFQATADKDIFILSSVHQLRLTMSRGEWDVLQTTDGRFGAGDGGTDYTRSDGRLVHVGSGFRGSFPWVHVDMQVDG